MFLMVEAVVVVVVFVGKRALGIIFMKRIVVAVRLLLILSLHRSLLDNGRLYCHPLLPLLLLLLLALNIHKTDRNSLQMALCTYLASNCYSSFVPTMRLWTVGSQQGQGSVYQWNID